MSSNGEYPSSSDARRGSAALASQASDASSTTTSWPSSSSTDTGWGSVKNSSGGASAANSGSVVTVRVTRGHQRFRSSRAITTGRSNASLAQVTTASNEPPVTLH